MSAARWRLLSCGCQVTLYGGVPAPTWCPDCRQSVTSSDRGRDEQRVSHDRAAWMAARLDELRAAAYERDTIRVDALLDQLADAPAWMHRLADLLQHVK